MNIILRCVSDDWKIEQRLAKLLLVTKLMTAATAKPIHKLGYQLSSSFAWDPWETGGRASANDAGFRTVKILYPNNAVDIGSFSHTLNHVREKMETSILEQFFKAWISLCVHSPRGRITFKKQTRQRSKNHCPNR